MINDYHNVRLKAGKIGPRPGYLVQVLGLPETSRDQEWASNWRTSGGCDSMIISNH